MHMVFPHAIDVSFYCVFTRVYPCVCVCVCVCVYRSEGHLCLPVRYTHAFSEALQKLRSGDFRYVPPLVPVLLVRR